ncbi:MAG: aminotransferase class I/II-fold pyridoxal phosphate-dependent enzyme [Clostridiaceae bacterium]|nr:aminotransferase class I/II-fold pyridoxal phosphate-dependent enzyme [Clostridiaceae bacterium]
MNIHKASRAELLRMQKDLTAEYEGYRALGLKLNMARGLPSREQLDLCEGLLTVLSKNEDMKEGTVDVRNYGVLEGLPACRELFAELLEVSPELVLAGGNSSLTLMYDALMRLWVYGAAGVGKPWCREAKIRWLCPVPGYDRHFAMTEQLGIEMIPIPMREDGPDMEEVERLVADPMVKGIWCVPKYSNPEGKVYSDEVVRRFAAMKTAAPDFRIFWDNAYCVHDLTEDPQKLLNIIPECEKAGCPDRVFEFASTSKISYPGAGVSCMVSSAANIAWMKKYMAKQMVGPDKVNQLRHVRYFKNANGIRAHMKKHAGILQPKFDLVLNTLEDRLGGTGAGSWHKPEGGYFISFDAMPGCARRINDLCRDAGVLLTGAGATWPYGRDPEDKNQRIAPTFPPIVELKTAIEVFCTCALLAAVEKRLAE